MVPQSGRIIALYRFHPSTPPSRGSQQKTRTKMLEFCFQQFKASFNCLGIEGRSRLIDPGWSAIRAGCVSIQRFVRTLDPMLPNLTFHELLVTWAPFDLALNCLILRRPDCTSSPLTPPNKSLWMEPTGEPVDSDLT